MKERLIVIVAPPGVTLQDATGPWEVFCRAAIYVPGAYRVVMASAQAETRVSTKFGLEMVCHCSIDDVEATADTVLVAGSDQGVSGQPAPAFLEWLRSRRKTTRRLGSICTGAFYLARAGLLSGRRATTHWRYLRQLGDDFPDVRVEPDPIFVRDGSIYTSAGITAGIDLALALVEEDCGSVIAQNIARDLVVFVQRQANQAQVSATLTHRMADRTPLRELQRWIPDHLHSIDGVADLAARVNMSPRNFARLFKRETGVSPGRYLRQVRAEAAQRRLQESRGTHAAVASEVGFGSARAMQGSLRPSLRVAGKSRRS